MHEHTAIRRLSDGTILLSQSGSVDPEALQTAARNSGILDTDVEVVLVSDAELRSALAAQQPPPSGADEAARIEREALPHLLRWVATQPGAPPEIVDLATRAEAARQQER